MDQKGSLFG